ncbi:hypothetical protein BDQ17DRAFT_1332006 [Cyathus striatus]|nr:hypothetical protein BDQ17DRAFT_1332006 [Cyathus striatus]
MHKTWCGLGLEKEWEGRSRGEARGSGGDTTLMHAYRHTSMTHLCIGHSLCLWKEGEGESGGELRQEWKGGCHCRGVGLASSGDERGRLMSSGDEARVGGDKGGMGGGGILTMHLCVQCEGGVGRREWGTSEGGTGGGATSTHTHRLTLTMGPSIGGGLSIIDAALVNGVIVFAKQGGGWRDLCHCCDAWEGGGAARVVVEMIVYKIVDDAVQRLDMGDGKVSGGRDVPGNQQHAISLEGDIEVG